MKKYLGMDIALRCTGYGVVASDGHSYNALDAGVIRTSRKNLLSDCLRRLAVGTDELLQTYTPDVVVVEGGFFARNAKTAMVLGAARGVVIATVAGAGIPIYEYAPRRIKQSVCGYGNAGKDQVALLTAQRLRIDLKHLAADATDALAVALCHIQTEHTVQGLALPDQL